VRKIPASDTKTVKLSGRRENNVYAASCDGYYSAAISGRFSGTSFDLSVVATTSSPGCMNAVGNFTLTATLQR
jgi:hypothetical protein